MAKPFLFAAAVANFVLIVSSSAKVHSHASSSSSSSSSHTSSSAHSESFAIATAGHSHSKVHSYASSSASSSSSHASSSAHSGSVAMAGHSNYHPPPPCETPPTAKPCRTKQRPKCHNKYEIFSNCPVTVCRPKTCDEVGFPVACVDLNPNGTCPVPPECICIEDYVRNHKDICIHKKDCPSCGGDCNAVSGCNSKCNQLCSKLNEKPVACTADCVYNSCECKKGYVFDEVQDKCVHPSHCTCKSNEVYTECEQALCGPKTCDQLKFPVFCLDIDPKYCTKGCICKEGYLRDKYGECIPEDQCPPNCGPHEFPSNCMQADCAPQNCTQLGFPIVCVRVDPKHCKKGCLCKEGYARNSDGVCIPVKKCPSCGGDPNAETDECASNCGRLCSNYNRTDVVCTLECAINGCQCKKGYVLDTNTNRCVLPCDCTPTCGKHEVFSTCKQADCAPQKCTQLGFPIACPRVDPKYCKKGCLCKPGYVRNSAGVCIPVKKCPSCGGDPNAEGDECASNCGRLCSNYNETNVVCTLECAINGCQCKKGYVLDTNTNRCVLPCDCTPTCGKHEVFSTCKQADCAPQKCTQLGFPIACPRVDPKYCKKGCLCKSGYVRNSAGVCIPVKKCPSCGGDPNAEGDKCASNCGRLCSNYNETNVVCTLECAINGCQCKKGYVLDTNTNRCVLPCDCTPTCGKHEVFSTCKQADCAPQKCTQLGFPIACPRVDPKYCKKGCLCKSGYARNSAGVCIPVKKCPSCGGDPNAEGDECASNCGRLCSNYNETNVVCTLECAINGCQCKKGYVLDTNTNRCVLPCDCTPTCGKHEVFSTCKQADCAPQKCTQLGFPIACPRVDPKYCKKGCLCKPGYVRNSAGVCIPVKKCPSCGGDPNAEGGECASNCGRLCSNYNRTDVVCTLECAINGCQCKKGYVLDTNTNRCVLPCDCTPDCKEYEIYSECINNPCPVINCSHVGLWVDCLQFDTKCCIKGCVCQSPLMREDDGSCVPIEQCKTPVCKENEVYSKCINGGCTPKNCSQIGHPIKCAKIDPKYCIKGCLCKEGYLREADGTCVPEKKCKKVCKKNEVYSECINGGCTPKNCSQIGHPIKCVKIDPKYCIKGCLCKEGYLREADGTCVPEKKCKKDCKKNEVYSDCINGGCTPKNCSEIGYPIKCVKIDPKYCIKGCLCKEGYLREADGTCVPEKKCKKVCKKNEVYSDCINGGCTPKNCSQIGHPIKCVKIDPKYCIKGCLCKEGYLREADGTCVPEKKCKKKCTKPNEYYDPCGYDCPSQSCKSINKTQHCPIQTSDNCKPVCKCKDGFFRNLIGECITKKHCLQCPGKHEYWSCGGACDNVCKDLHKQNQTNCPIVNVKCNERCYCKKNYARAKNGTCIPITKCNEPQCGKNERYEKCPARLTEPQKCSELGCPLPDPPCSDDGKCPVKPACVCICGYVRNDKGVCIPKKDCPKCGGDPNAESGCGINCNKKCEDILKEPGSCILPCKKNSCDCKKGYYYNKEKKQCVLPSECNVCTKSNEYLELCDRGCPPNTCESLDMAYVCPIREEDKCAPRCKCKPGFFRNKNGECITEKQCLKCTGPHEYWSCGGACDNVCKDLHKQNQTNCPVKNIQCNEMCYCVKNYARAKNGTCIPIKKCNEPQCRKNERYEKCPARLTEPQKCSELGCSLPEPPCSDDDKCPVKPACVCIYGYVRNDKGVCIPKKDCPCCGGDPNAQSGCGTNCNKKCEDLGAEPVLCITECKKNSCDCKDGYYYSKEKKKCVLACECPGVCKGANEVYEDCTNPSCRPTKCCEVGFPLNCTKPPACKKGCTCKDGYVRNTKGICVTLKQCGTCGGDKNAESGSGVNCLKKCYDLQYPEKPKPCPKIWKVNACDCKKGFYLDEVKNKCVRAKNCPHSCPENEVYDSCINGGCGHRNCSQLGGPMLCIDPIECFGGCTCKEGYLRLDATGKCVPENQCPESCTKPNEIYVKCPPKCPQTCESLNHTSHCQHIKSKKNDNDCIGECRCKENFYRNLNGECISKEDCLKCTGAHEYFSCGPACDNVCCDLDTKSKDNCPIKNVKCVEKCYCEDGYARDKDGVCICISDCPDRKTTTCKPVVNSTLALENFEEGNVKTSIKFLKLLCDSRPGENFMISILSILTVLAQITLPAIGEALKQLLGFENLSNKEKIRTVFPIIMDKLNRQEHGKLVIANKIYGNIIYPFSKPFKQDASLFKSEVENINFSRNVEAAEKINDWVKSKTEGLIDNLVSEDMFNGQTRVAILNCIYFLGDWVKQFNPDNTHPRDFYINGKDTVSIPTMYQEDRFKCLDSKDLDAECVLLPYKGGENSLLICIPKKIDGLKALLDKFDIDTLDKILNSLKEEKLKIFIPRFKFPTNFSDLKEVLVKIGLGVIFEESNYFDGIFENGEKLMVSDMMQKSQMNVDETGTEAAVTTGLIMGTTAVEIVRSFEWNRPGVFFLFSKGHLILCGIYAGGQS